MVQYEDISSCFTSFYSVQNDKRKEADFHFTCFTCYGATLVASLVRKIYIFVFIFLTPLAIALKCCNYVCFGNKYRRIYFLTALVIINRMSIKRIALFFSTFFVLFVYAIFPTNVEAVTSFTAETISACAVKLDWVSDLTNPDQFVIRYALNAPIGTHSPVSITANGSARSLLVTNLTPNTPNYFFDIYKLSTADKRESSSPKSVPTKALPPRPTIPTFSSAIGVISGDKYTTTIGFSGSGFSSLFDNFGGVVLLRDGKEIFSGLLLHPNGQFVYSDSDVVLNSGNAYTYTVKFFESDEGCVASDYLYSDSLSFVVPSVPTNAMAVFSLPDKVTVTWQSGTGQDKNEIYRDGVLVKSVGASETLFVDTNTTPSAKYIYSVRGCSNTGGCSAFNETNSVTIENAPQNLQARISSMDTTKASVLLSWNNGWPNENYVIEQAGADGVFREIGAVLFPPDQAATYLVENLSANSLFKFRIKSEIVPNYSSIVEISTKIKYLLSGQAWSSIDGHGIGWIKFACKKSDLNCKGQEFSVYIDDAGYLHGGAWASVDTYGRGYGWLSFEKADIEKCPQGICAAKLMEDGSIRGWARFTSRIGKLDPEWDGWVALNSEKIEGGPLSGISPYSYAQLKNAFQSFSDSVSFKNIWGIIKYSVLSVVDVVKTYAQTTTWGIIIDQGSVRGQAWGGDVVGWIAFSLDECNGFCNVVAESVDGSNNSNNFALRSDPIGTSLVPRERMKFWTDPHVDASWSLSLINGSTSNLGTINPVATNNESTTTIYSAPDSGNLIIKVAATDTIGTASVALNILKNPYELSCQSTRNGTIIVSWPQQYTDVNYINYAPHVMSLSYSTFSDAGPWKLLTNPSMGGGTYSHNSITPLTSYWYKLDTTFSSPALTLPVVTPPCVPYRLVTDEPTQLGVFSVDDHTLIANWKDNATSSAGYRFEIERMKITPASSTLVGINSVTSQRVALTWENITTSTPFYMWVERSSTTDAMKRFLNSDKKDPTYPACSSHEDASCTIEKISEYWPTVNGTGKNKIFIGRTEPIIGESNVGSEGEATSFFYRIRACSVIDPQYTTCNGSSCELNVDFRRSPVCSSFVSTSSLGTVIATTTPPMPVVKFATSSVPTKVDSNDPKTKYKIKFKWQDSSLKEDGVIIERNGQIAVEQDGSIVFVDNPSDPKIFGPYSGKGDWDSFEDKTLELGTSYTYTARSFFDTEDPITHDQIRVLSPYGEAPTVTVKIGTLARQENKLKGTVSLFTANVYDAIASFASEIKDMVTGIFSTNAAPDPKERYFMPIKDYLDNYTQSSLKDTPLEPGAVYAYRVRINYGDGKTSAWNTDINGRPQWLAGKVLPFGASLNGGESPICTRNSYCDFSVKTQTAIGEKSETQCKQNADCLDIGRKRQTSEEQ